MHNFFLVHFFNFSFYLSKWFFLLVEKHVSAICVICVFKLNIYFEQRIQIVYVYINNIKQPDIIHGKIKYIIQNKYSINRLEI